MAQGKALNMLNEIYLILKKKGFCWRWQDASCMEKLCSGMILAHSSTQSSNTKGSAGPFYALWALIISYGDVWYWGYPDFWV